MGGKCSLRWAALRGAGLSELPTRSGLLVERPGRVGSVSCSLPAVTTDFTPSLSVNGIILGGPDCSNKVSLTGWLVNNRHLFLSALEAGSPRSGCQHGRPLMRALFWAGDYCLLCASSGKEEDGTLWGPFCKSISPIMRAPLSRPNHLPETPPPNPITLGVRILIQEIGGDTNLQSVTATEV